MRLRSFSVSNFQSYVETQTVELDSHLTLVAGRNNVGKSALLRAMRVLADVQEGAGEGFEVSYEWELSVGELTAGVRGLEGCVELTNALAGPDFHTVIVAFRTGNADGPLHPQNLYCSRLEVPSAALVGRGRHPDGYLTWEAGPFKPVEGSPSRGGDVLGAAVKQLVERIAYVAPRQVQRGVRHLYPQPQLTPDASNLSDVLVDLQLNHLTTAHRALVDFMREAFPEIEAITVHTAQESNASGLVGEPHVLYQGGRAVPLRLCGSGIEQLLALAVVVLLAPAGQVFLIDEPQAYLHPHAERSLLGLLDAHPQHQYVVATHSHMLLSARPLSQARLLTFVEGATRISQLQQPADVLDELGITGADLWLADRVLWVEGPSEQEVAQMIMEREFTDGERAGLTVRRMPEAASRFSARTARRAEAAYRFCDHVTAAVSPLPVRMLFLFDGDEKSEDQRARIEQASGQRAVFLPVRELENLLLEPAAIATALADATRDLGRAAPVPDEVEAALGELLSQIDDPRLFPSGPPSDAGVEVRGSEALERLYWAFLESSYDKVRDGLLLASCVQEQAPQRLEPLRRLLQDLATI